MALNFYPYTVLIGGGTGALDGEDGTALADGDAAVVITDAGVYWYHLNETSAATENSPFRIAPDANAGNKRWHLVGTTVKIGALVYMSSADALTTGVSKILTWGAETYDVGGFWDGGDPTKLIIPIGVTSVKVSANLKFESNATGQRYALIFKDAASFDGYPQQRLVAAGSNPLEINITSAKVDVTAASYFTVYANQNSGVELDIEAVDHTWFSIEAVGFA